MKPDGKLKLETTETVVSKDDSTPRKKPHRKPELPASAKADEAGTTKPGDAKPTGNADGEQPTADIDAGESEQPSTARDSGDGKKSGKNHGSTRSHADKPGKLKFAKDETPPTADTTSSDKKTPGRKLEKAQYKAERSGVKLDEARKNLPKKRSIRREKVFCVDLKDAVQDILSYDNAKQ